MGFFKDNFTGTGSMKAFVEWFNHIAKSLNNLEIKMPTNIKGQNAKVNFLRGKIQLDFSNVDFRRKETGADPYYDDEQNRGGTTSGGSSGGLPSGGLEGMMLQRNSEGEAVWDFVRLSNIYDEV